MPLLAETDAYGCKCGFMTQDRAKFFSHLRAAGRQDGKGVHASIGHVNMETGEVTMPPWNERTKQQKLESLDPESPSGKAASSAVSAKPTTVLTEATGVKYQPRVYQSVLTPIMQTSFQAAVREWGWRQDMPFENFIDTVLYHYFWEHGVTLQGYFIEGEEEEKPPVTEPEPEPAIELPEPSFSGNGFSEIFQILQEV